MGWFCRIVAHGYTRVFTCITCYLPVYLQSVPFVCTDFVRRNNANGYQDLHNANVELDTFVKPLTHNVFNAVPEGQKTKSKSVAD